LTYLVQSHSKLRQLELAIVYWLLHLTCLLHLLFKQTGQIFVLMLQYAYRLKYKNSIRSLCVLDINLLLSKWTGTKAKTIKELFWTYDRKWWRKCLLNSPCHSKQFILILNRWILNISYETSKWLMGDKVVLQITKIMIYKN